MSILEQAAAKLREIGCEVLENEPMKRHTSFKIGGEADLLVTVNTKKQLAQALGYIREIDIPLMFMGNGTNMLVSDKGIRGIVLKLGGEFCEIFLEDENTIRCGAGALLVTVCRFALENSLTGLEFAYGIPGSVGGAAFMNAGAYGGETKDVAVSCECITKDGEYITVENEDCDFAYRHSRFSDSGELVTEVTFRLEKGDAEKIREQMDDIMGRRKDKQPIELPSAGSVFKRPVGYFAGGLIQECGLKGHTVGGAQVSMKHSGFIVNIGDATCNDVLELIAYIQKTVLDEKGVQLECEVRAVGDEV
ncbi:MAG: UDP-N-acetylmuramate dehydrogenase [Ruminococcaceae bacterium]|nr:UDP-N-acetylmuramate dehydrogenase [Oscillospiraceae bacterium]